MEKRIQKIIAFVLYSMLFIFPFFFLSFTQEFFITNKFYLLVFGGLFILSLSILNFVLSKKISWQKRLFDNFIFLFLTAITLSILFSSPNKIQALLNPNFGLIMMISLSTLYFYLSRGNETVKQFSNLAFFSSLFLSIATIIFYFQPFKNINLPQSYIFLKNSAFTPLGSQFDLAVFLGFFAVLNIANMVSNESKNLANRRLIINYFLLILNLVALFLTVYSLIKLNVLLPPFRLSWYAALEILKNPRTAFFGAGIDNFSSVFTRVKDLAYNQSSLWQINSFNVSRSAILQILTETGILGFLSFSMLIFNIVKRFNKKSYLFISSFLYLFICLLVFPSSLIIWFLFFVLLAKFSQQYSSEATEQSINLSELLPLYLGIALISLFLIGSVGYFSGRSYLSEYYFKKSLDGYVSDSIKKLYDNQRQAIILNPYIERFRSNFAQTNLIVANNLVQKQAKDITEQDKQIVTQAIQAAIAEAKATVGLNPQKAENWQNLANIYQNIINVAQGSDVWTISAYQRAIVIDPQNVSYRIALGGVYFSLEKYDEAASFFQQAVELKPNYPNAQYNYAWASFKRKNYSQAVLLMQSVLSLLDQKTNKEDYKKASKDLEEFKKMLPVEKETAKTEEIKPGTLALPSPPTARVSPKLELPKKASPEAK